MLVIFLRQIKSTIRLSSKYECFCLKEGLKTLDCNTQNSDKLNFGQTLTIPTHILWSTYHVAIFQRIYQALTMYLYTLCYVLFVCFQHRV